MKANRNLFSQLALNLAEVNLGKTKTNPSVGCVIVQNGSVISSGTSLHKHNKKKENKKCLLYL